MTLFNVQSCIVTTVERIPNSVNRNPTLPEHQAPSLNYAFDSSGMKPSEKTFVDVCATPSLITSNDSEDDSKQCSATHHY